MSEEKERLPKRIPIVRAKEIAERYGYAQVVILARNPEHHDCEPPYGGWIVTYGKNAAHCQVAEMMGNVFKGLESGAYTLRMAESFEEVTDLLDRKGD